jgi:hypothetical protein
MRPIGKPKSRWEDNIKMDFKGNRVFGVGGVDWINVAEDRNCGWYAFVEIISFSHSCWNIVHLPGHADEVLCFLFSSASL